MGGLFGNVFDVAIKPQLSVHLHSQNVDGVLEWERNTIAAQLPLSC